YSLTLSTQNAKAINSATVRIYIDNNTTLSGVYKSNGTAVTTYSAGVTGNYACYDVVFNDVAPNSYITYTVKTIVKNNITDQISIKHCAQVMDYSYAGSCYDKNITPGAMTVGIASQNSEAVTPVVTVGQAEKAENIDLIDSSQANITIESDGTAIVEVLVSDAKRFDSSILTAVSGDNSVLSVSVDGNVSKIANTNAKVTIYLRAAAVTENKSTTVTIKLTSNPNKVLTLNVSVKAPEPVTPPPADPGNNNNENGGGTTV
ncbi:MAG: hypothetical protein ACI4KO_07840, partial [Ruminiclostridium sp.]